MNIPTPVKNAMIMGPYTNQYVGGFTYPRLIARKPKVESLLNMHVQVKNVGSRSRYFTGISRIQHIIIIAALKPYRRKPDKSVVARYTIKKVSFVAL